jgi:hypothetical protein
MERFVNSASVSASTCQAPAGTNSGGDKPPQVGGSEEKSVEFFLHLQSTNALLTVLANVARMGCAVQRMNVVETQAFLSVNKPRQITAHRVTSCLAQLVGVLSITVV